MYLLIAILDHRCQVVIGFTGFSPLSPMLFDKRCYLVLQQIFLFLIISGITIALLCLSNLLGIALQQFHHSRRHIAVEGSLRGIA